mmetsp:Transcript_12157/g.23073  ORF Transcript_12157/g.23073 Transcript_12157/m.23073 type:complete len:519 (-) Transcript_12157:41-1597(-)
MLASLFDVGLKFIDTAGWDPHDTPNSKSLVSKMILQTNQALLLSDLAMMVIDAKEGVSKYDMELAKYLKGVLKEESTTRDIILVANKCESISANITGEVLKLGFGNPVYISAEHNEGMSDLYAAIKDKIPPEYFAAYRERIEKRKDRHHEIKMAQFEELKALEAETGDDFDLKEWSKEYDRFNQPDMSDYDSDNEADLKHALTPKVSDPKEALTEFKKRRPIQMSFLGMPNVGKSTLINRLIKQDRMIVDKEPGTTRDAVYIEHIHNGRKFCLVDTAGIRKHYEGNVEKMMQIDARRAMKYSQVVVFLFDAMKAISRHELNLIREIIEEGRIAVIVGNKWDLVSKDWKSKAVKFFYATLHSKIDLKSVKLMFISARTGMQVGQLFEQIAELYEAWNTRISTGLLNKWLEAYKKVQNMPSSGGGRLLIRYITQIKVRPPTFYLHCNNRTLMKDNYFKSFSAALTREFKLEGVPVRILIKDKGSKAITSGEGEFSVKKKSDVFKSNQKPSLTRPIKSGRS